MIPLALTKSLLRRLTAPKQKMSKAVVIDAAILGGLPDHQGMISRMVRTLVFGKEAMEDFHCAQALHNGVDDYGRVFVDFDKKRREHVVRCMIWVACNNARARKNNGQKE